MKNLLFSILFVLILGGGIFFLWERDICISENSSLDTTEQSLSGFEIVMENEGDIMYLAKYDYATPSTTMIQYNKPEHKIIESMEIPFLFIISDMQQGYLIGELHNCQGCADIKPPTVVLFNPTIKKWVNMGGVKEVQIRQLEDGEKIASFETYISTYEPCENDEFCSRGSRLVHTPSGIREDWGLRY